MLKNLNIVLVETRFPENIGAVARASANFGGSPITLVNPEWWDKEKALPMATAQGKPLLDTITVMKELPDALADCTLTFATTARLGGWRNELLSPREAAQKIVNRLAENERVALVFGPEDRGLENAHLVHCQHLIHIPTDTDSSSLNLAQAVLILLYECFLLFPEAKVPKNTRPSRRIKNEERERLFSTLKTTMMNIDFLDKENPDYFFLAMSKLLDRTELRKHELNMIMGICRQVQRLQKRHNEDSDKEYSDLKRPYNEEVGHKKRNEGESFE